ncbi:MAG: nucleotidyl transferase AbiEii/AbiGii toxin family protein [Planctomycetota bacterium]
MSITTFQRDICRLIAAQRRRTGESYIAGGVALNTLLKAPRISRDIDLFHDTEEALRVSANDDRRELMARGYALQVLRESPTFVEATVSKSGDTVVMQWVRDSAFRFFPLIEDEIFGLVLHPFDLAANKVLALAGRLEARDWLDVLECHDKIQPLGYLAWAACGKDPGFSPPSLLSEARRGSRYSQAELDELAFETEPPDARQLGARWHVMLAEADQITAALPHQEAGKVVLAESGELYRRSADVLVADLARGSVRFHAGCIRGVWPTIKPAGGGVSPS